MSALLRSLAALEALGSIRAVNKSTAPEELDAMLGAHRSAIVEVGGDVQRLHERIERMLPEAEKAFARAKRDATAVWVPEGDTGRMEARYMLADGSVRFGRSTEKIPLPNGDVEEFVSHGFLSDPYPVTASQQEAQRTYYGFALAHTRARKMDPNGVWRDTLVRKAFVQFRKAMMAVPGRIGEYFQRLFTDPEMWKRVIDKTSGQGSELIQTPTISVLRRPADLARRIPGLVRSMEAPAASFKQPIVTGRGLAKKRGATTDDPARFAVQRFTTSDTTLTVVDRVIQGLVDPLWVADAGQILDDPMGFVVDWLMSGDLDTLELAFLHGDTAGTHQDTIATWTMGGLYTAGDLDGGDSPLKFWIGWRGRAIDDSKTASAGGSWDASDHFSLINLLGNHSGGDVVCVTGLDCLYTQLLGYSSFLTVQNYGDRATLITGEVGSIGGKPVVISEMMPKQFSTSTGVYTGSNNGNAIVAVDLDSWTYWEHSGGADDYDALYPERGARYVGMVRRGLLAPNCISTETPCAELYNL